MSDDVKEWLGLSIFNALIFILVIAVMVITSFLNNTPTGIIAKVVMAIASSVEIINAFICWDVFLIEIYKEKKI